MGNQWRNKHHRKKVKEKHRKRKIETAERDTLGGVLSVAIISEKVFFFAISSFFGKLLTLRWRQFRLSY